MYRVTGWPDPETVYLETWDDVIALFTCLEEDMYQSILVVNVDTGKAVVEMSLN